MQSSNSSYLFFYYKAVDVVNGSHEFYSKVKLTVQQ